MKLKEVEISEFQSIRRSNPFKVGDITCMVGKNEAGKTALLQALYRLNPIIESEGNYDITDDYPRKDVGDYIHDVERESREPATVAKATYMLEDNELGKLQNDFGKEVLQKPELVLTKGYDNVRRFTLEVNRNSVLKSLFKTAQLSPEHTKTLLQLSDVSEQLDFLKKTDSIQEANQLITVLNSIDKLGSLDAYIYKNYLEPQVPKFLYFDEYYQLRGHENIEALIQRGKDKNLTHSDYPLLGLIELARLKLKELTTPTRTRELKNKLEAAGNHLTKKIVDYWSQNKHLQMKFDVRPALANDPIGMRSGTNIWGEVYDTKHMVTTELGTRSKGFVWFFSFLAWYSRLQQENKPIILLLDEPALFLHAKAQDDLLRYFEAELKPYHQVIYTTHSPFMVDSHHFERVRIVEDKSIDTDEKLPLEKEGTKVLSEALEASEDSLFPLQGALGYEIYQPLFVGPNSLVVEGVSDLLYIETIKGLLEEQGRSGLDSRWTITPVGGSDKVPTFVALIGAQKKLKVATLIDVQKKDRQTIENLYIKKLLKKKHVLTFADFTSSTEADIEDMFEVDFYLKLVNAEFAPNLKKSITKTDINNKAPRVLVLLEQYFKANPMKDTPFNHYRPARYFSENIATLKNHISKETLDRFENAFKTLNALL